MKEWLIIATEAAITLTDWLALLVIVYATIEASIRVVPLLFQVAATKQRSDIWLRYARWLVAALTFQLAADIIESSITINWESLARLGAIAVIRTFLNYFLERDVETIEAQDTVPAQPRERAR
jgi:uncharacterized membrane protein